MFQKLAHYLESKMFLGVMEICDGGMASLAFEMLMLTNNVNLSDLYNGYK